MIQDSILVCSPDLRIPHTAQEQGQKRVLKPTCKKALYDSKSKSHLNFIPKINTQEPKSPWPKQGHPTGPIVSSPPFLLVDLLDYPLVHTPQLFDFLPEHTKDNTLCCGNLDTLLHSTYAVKVTQNWMGQWESTTYLRRHALFGLCSNRATPGQHVEFSLLNSYSSPPHTRKLFDFFFDHHPGYHFTLF
jgi:hypothetical protein